MDAPLYNQEGKEVGKVALPESIFGHRMNADLVHQVVTSMEANARMPVAHTKDRGDVRGGGKKPWRQKGTGRARHGSIRSPIWRGGGVTHGPRNEKNYTKRINKKMRAKALYAVLSQKLRDDEVIFIESITLPEPKTRDAKHLLGVLARGSKHPDLSSRRRNAALIALAGHDETTAKSFRNFGNAAVDETRNLNPRDVLQYKYLIIVNPNESIKILDKRKMKNEKRKTATQNSKQTSPRT